MARAPRSRGRPRAATATAFSRWLDAEGRTRAWAAEKLDVQVGTVNRLCRAVRRPSLDLAAAIEKLTEGAVTITSWTRKP